MLSKGAVVKVGGVLDRRGACGVTATVFGVLAGIGGATHGVGEGVAGRGAGRRDRARLVDDRADRAKHGGEPGITLLPTAGTAGAVTLVFAGLVVAWSILGIPAPSWGPGPHGAVVGHVAGRRRCRPAGDGHAGWRSGGRGVGRQPRRVRRLSAGAVARLGGLWPLVFVLAVANGSFLVVGSLVLVYSIDFHQPALLRCSFYLCVLSLLALLVTAPAYDARPPEEGMDRVEGRPRGEASNSGGDTVSPQPERGVTMSAPTAGPVCPTRRPRGEDATRADAGDQGVATQPRGGGRTCGEREPAADQGTAVRARFGHRGRRGPGRCVDDVPAGSGRWREGALALQPRDRQGRADRGSPARHAFGVPPAVPGSGWLEVGAGGHLLRVPPSPGRTPEHDVAGGPAAPGESATAAGLPGWLRGPPPSRPSSCGSRCWPKLWGSRCSPPATRSPTPQGCPTSLRVPSSGATRRATRRCWRSWTHTNATDRPGASCPRGRNAPKHAERPGRRFRPNRSPNLGLGQGRPCSTPDLSVWSVGCAAFGPDRGWWASSGEPGTVRLPKLGDGGSV